ncbi:hypothetical protein [Zunongwangia endophytica]|uniref:Outer membrane protein beta-barrel domain-containing protein n=1 Tax=Zunongwangia endophytica TaxID=1808945 RepID=A0ABV8HA70_9FLAO|nr:hypothetical protein [Zunongwangia endophytica]MDN3593940.1 hypothetical protein [Zunongwangia endophytica]
MKTRVLLIMLFTSFHCFSQCYDLGPKRKNNDSYFFVAAGADPIPNQKWINVQDPEFTTDGLDLVFKAGYGTNSFFVPIELNLFYERFEDVNYQQFGIGGSIYTIFLNNKIQALAGGDLGIVNREYPLNNNLESDQFVNLSIDLELRYILNSNFRIGIQFNFEKRDDIKPDIENRNYYVGSSYAFLYYTF